MILTVTNPPAETVPALTGATVVLPTPSSSKVVPALVPRVRLAGESWLLPETEIRNAAPSATVIPPALICAELITSFPALTIVTPL